MRKDKTKAVALRRTNKSYNEISRLLKIPKSTLATWFKNDELSRKTRNLLTEQNRKQSAERIKKLVRINTIRWERWREKARQEARLEFPNLIKNPLFAYGLLLYWAEGDNKSRNPCRFTNTDPRMIALYLKFLIRALKIPKENIRVAMILYPDLSENKCINFWSKITNLPKGQFYKTQFIKGRHPTIRLSNGICMVNCGNRQLKEKIIVWIDLLSKKI